MESHISFNPFDFPEYSDSYKSRMFRTPFGVELGVYNGVVGYSNGGDHHFSDETNFVGRSFTGIKWQCVEYARRWLILKRNITFSQVDGAADIWSLSSFKSTRNSIRYPITKTNNGSAEPPSQHSILIWKRSGSTPFGHVAIITEVSLDMKYIRVAEQNFDNDYWPADYSRQIDLKLDSGKWYIEDEEPLYGWIDIDNTH